MVGACEKAISCDIYLHMEFKKKKTLPEDKKKDIFESLLKLF